MRVRLAHVEPKDFADGLRCAHCDKLLFASGGRRAADDLIYERRLRAQPILGEGSLRFAWLWELICDDCAHEEPSL